MEYTGYAIHTQIIVKACILSMCLSVLHTWSTLVMLYTHKSLSRPAFYPCVWISTTHMEYTGYVSNSVYTNHPTHPNNTFLSFLTISLNCKHITQHNVCEFSIQNWCEQTFSNPGFLLRSLWYPHNTFISQLSVFMTAVPGRSCKSCTQCQVSMCQLCSLAYQCQTRSK